MDGRWIGSGWKVDGKRERWDERWDERWEENGIGSGWEVDGMGSFYINKKKCCFICIYANFFVPLQPK